MTTATRVNTDPAVAAAALLAQLFRGLGDPTRVRILRILLDEGDKSVSELVAMLEMPQGRVSSHLACLRQCGFAISYRDGRSMRYTVVDRAIAELLRLGSEMLAGNAERVLACQVVKQ